LQEEAIRIFEGIDQDRTNNISYTEFLAASLSRRLWLSRERIKDAFQRLDVDNKGYITQDNLKELLGDDWTPERVATMMRDADTKGDGRIGMHH
jgi:Ca2+-binding EF-hand superfamily protein